MALQPQQLDPLPIPDAPQPGQNPPVPPAAQPQAGMGYVHKSGAGAYLASNILTGWMAGRNFAQQKKLDQAKQDIVGAKTAYDVTEQSYKNLIDQGLDPSKPEDKQKLDAATTAMHAAWTNYLDRAQKYSTPDDGGKKSKGKKIESGLHDAFMGHDPQMFVDSSLKLLRSSGPPGLSYGTSQEQKNKLALEKVQLQQNENIIKEQNEQAASRADKDALLKQFKTGTPAEQAQARLELKNKYGLDVETAQQMEASDKAAEVADKIAQTKLEAINTLNQPGKTSSDLTVAGRAALGIQLGPLDSYENYYQSLVGSKYKTSAEAGIAANKKYLSDVAAAQSIAGRSATDRQWTQMRQAEATVLAHDLQDPATAKKYGLPGPLQAGQKVPDWLIEKSVMGRLKPSAQDRADAKVNVDRTISHGINNILTNLSPEDQKFAKDNLVDYDEDTKTYTISDKAPEKTKGGLFGLGGEKVGGVSAEDYAKKKAAFMDRLSRYMMKTNPGASKDRIMEGLQSADPSGYFVDSMPDSTPESNALTPPPQPGEQKETALGSEGPGKTSYYVELPGQGVQEMDLTEDEVKYIQQAHPGVTVRDVPIRNMPHGH